MGCVNCGCPTPRRKCKECALLDRVEEQANRDAERDRDWPECPECGGITSGTDVVCANCRTVGGDEA